ncbi:ABC transporter substrate-binding protein [Pseudooceanicola sp. 216_PA32_1]|uniref:ABC transporter substrate-binding protein n=1 Tax=Pseudooceanicola pacificus TaxID=2676438 RepID=A0A844WDX5_9RHOB|nr:ABC transporter substrate-binding protein [Pseudooceanicola pacificus]MWB77089.1 ABC transporter substrate-binding protein [Pseudooceanicola pacificus]
MFLSISGRTRGLALLCCALLPVPGTACAQPTGYPLTIANCNRVTTYERAPERAVSIGQGTTEILLSLGLADRVVGTAIWLSPLPESLVEAGRTLPRIADKSPGFEAVLKTRPDFVAAQWINDIAPDQARVGTYAQFDDFGIRTYVSPAECAKSEFSAGSGDGARAQPWTVDLLNREITELAGIFDVPARGADLVAANASRIATAAADAEALQAKDISVLYWFSSPEIAGEAYVAGRFGAPAWISDVVGVRNVITSDEEWPLVGWETISQLDPDVIVLGTMDRRNFPADDVTAKRAFLQSDPVASQLRAVREGHLIDMPAHSMNPTLRAVDGVEVLARGLKAIGLTR